MVLMLNVWLQTTVRRVPGELCRGTVLAARTHLVLARLRMRGTRREECRRAGLEPAQEAVTP